MQHSACGCNTLRCVTLVLRRGRCPGGQQWWRRCRRGMDSVAVQMWAGDGLFRGAKVGKGSTQSRCRCGMGSGVGPGADVGGYEPSPAVSNGHNPKRRCGRIGASRTKLRCAAHTLRCNGCCCVQLPAERCSGAAHRCRLRCDATTSACPVCWAHPRGTLGVF